MGAKELERARAGRGKRANARGSVANAHAPRPGTPSSPSRAVPPVFQLPRSLWPRVGRGARSRRRAAPATLERTVATFLLAALPLAPPARHVRHPHARLATPIAPFDPHGVTCRVSAPVVHRSRGGRSKKEATRHGGDSSRRENPRASPRTPRTRVTAPSTAVHLARRDLKSEWW